MISNTLDFENLKPFDLIDSSFVVNKNNKYDSVVRIQHKKNKNFLTGFVIYEDDKGSYIITGALQIDSINDFKINEIEVEIIASGGDQGIDLTVIYVEKFFTLPFHLSTLTCANNNIEFRGYAVFSKDKFIVKTNTGKLVDENYQFKKANLPSSVNSNSIYYKIEAKENKSFEKGMSGSPIFCPESGDVIAVLSLTNGSKEGYAIPIQNLRKVWKDMPSQLLLGKKNKREYESY